MQLHDADDCVAKATNFGDAAGLAFYYVCIIRQCLLVPAISHIWILRTETFVEKPEHELGRALNIHKPGRRS
ncbi:MAG: hypothetical protein R6U93_03450 [Dehalococcoidia bacterium]